MRTISTLVLGAVLASAPACSDDEPTDTGSDAAVADASIDATEDPDCFPLSGPSSDVPDVIPSSFAAAEMWKRPTGETCPATGLGDTDVPFETICYVNDTGSTIDILFEVVAVDDFKPAGVIYDGEQIATDPQQCAAVSSDLVIDVADTYYTVPTGATITLVATAQVATDGDFQFVITPQ